MQLMRIGRCNQRFVEFRRDFHRAAIQVEHALVKMTELNRVEAIDFSQQSLPDRTAKYEEGMWRKGEDRQSAPGAEIADVVECF